MIFNKKDTLNDTNYTSHNNTLMLKMVTSYSIFLLIILVLFIFLYRSTINNARDSYDQQNETTLISNAELFESDLNIMEVYCCFQDERPKNDQRNPGGSLHSGYGEVPYRTDRKCVV